MSEAIKIVVCIECDKIFGTKEDFFAHIETCKAKRKTLEINNQEKKVVRKK